LQARAMVLAGGVLFVAGPPDVLDEEAALRSPYDPDTREKLEAQAAALTGKMGGRLLAASAEDGRCLAAYELGCMPTFDGMAAAGGRLYLTTIDGKVLCLGNRGMPLPASEIELETLDVSIKESDVPPAIGKGPSRAGDFERVVRAIVTASDLGYYVYSDEQRLGLALKKLPQPLAGKVKLATRMRVSPEGQIKNAFLVFGGSPDDARLIKCGLRYLQKKAVIVEGPMSDEATAQESFDAARNKVYDVEASIDLKSGQVTMKIAQTTVTATLKTPPTQITYVGYGVLRSAAEFGEVKAIPLGR
jgi:hypothetical protein